MCLCVCVCVCLCVCVCVCVCVCLCVCVCARIALSQTADPILTTIQANILADVCQCRFSIFLNEFDFNNVTVAMYVVDVCSGGTLTSLIMLQFFLFLFFKCCSLPY